MLRSNLCLCVCLLLACCCVLPAVAEQVASSVNVPPVVTAKDIKRGQLSLRSGLCVGPWWRGGWFGLLVVSTVYFGKRYTG